MKDGIVECKKVEYENGAVFGRAAFTNGIRKEDVIAKTDAKVIAINIEHPDLIKKIDVIINKFIQEEIRVKKIRPKTKLEKIDPKVITG